MACQSMTQYSNNVSAPTSLQSPTLPLVVQSLWLTSALQLARNTPRGDASISGSILGQNPDETLRVAHL